MSNPSARTDQAKRPENEGTAPAAGQRTTRAGRRRRRPQGVMHDGTRAVRRPRRALPSAARTAAAIAAAAVLALPAAACSGSTSSAGSGGSNAGGPANSQPLAFTQCVRSHGVPDYPDPTSGGGIPKKTAQQLGVSSSRLQAATQACQRLLPHGSSGMTQAQVQQMRARALSYARCMRAHGVTDFPDPGSDGHYPDPLEHRAENSPQFPAASRTCGQLVPGPSASPSQGGGS